MGSSEGISKGFILKPSRLLWSDLGAVVGAEMITCVTGGSGRSLDAAGIIWGSGTSAHQGPSILPIPDVPPDALLNHYSRQPPPPFLPVSSPPPPLSFFLSLPLLSPTLLPPAAIPSFVPRLPLDASPAADDAAITLMVNQCRSLYRRHHVSDWAGEGVVRRVRE